MIQNLQMRERETRGHDKIKKISNIKKIYVFYFLFLEAAVVDGSKESPYKKKKKE